MKWRSAIAVRFWKPRLLSRARGCDAVIALGAAVGRGPRLSARVGIGSPQSDTGLGGCKVGELNEDRGLLLFWKASSGRLVDGSSRSLGVSIEVQLRGVSLHS